MAGQWKNDMLARAEAERLRAPAPDVEVLIRMVDDLVDLIDIHGSQARDCEVPYRRLLKAIRAFAATPPVAPAPDVEAARGYVENLSRCTNAGAAWELLKVDDALANLRRALAGTSPAAPAPDVEAVLDAVRTAWQRQGQFMGMKSRHVMPASEAVLAAAVESNEALRNAERLIRALAGTP